ncbi:DUF2834 domain-containing protein [Stenotrophomonas geniculata]|uniref:DUF2834 domain-containing protein n=1 Tax=Stenotrophomonas TaxID=40323 RepID=UPI003D32D7C7
MQRIYLLLCTVGAALPLSQFLPWISAYGLNIPLLVAHAVSTPVSAFAWADVLVAAATVAVFILVEGQRLSMKQRWLPLAAVLVGPSLALPLFLMLRERHVSRQRAAYLRSPG